MDACALRLRPDIRKSEIWKNNIFSIEIIFRLTKIVKNADIIFGECPCETLTTANVPYTENTRNFTNI